MMQSAFDISKALTADFQFRYISALISQRIPAYSTADATLQWRVNHNVRLSVVGRNLFQPHHPEALGDPRGVLEIKRSVYGKITWTSKSK
jgi:iron complex outermembrane receptor protein